MLRRAGHTGAHSRVGCRGAPVITAAAVTGVLISEEAANDRRAVHASRSTDPLMGPLKEKRAPTLSGALLIGALPSLAPAFNCAPLPRGRLHRLLGRLRFKNVINTLGFSLFAVSVLFVPK
ncbi:hypothetical protein CDAR_35641 [Caerostris darwini]|uniref:Uncharacterized protein n=1 Tax=Caerostris darwini TaxID=1538125 RepID=A0AAV4VBE7_9ARAC|nr:hypothetical protein CDAR_35641 [Caerostris darwini]